MKILCCGFFPALQRTIEYASFRQGEVNRARKVSIAASGKATNAARVLKTLGADPQMLSFAGGANGDTVRELLKTEALPCRWIETRAETRICQTLLSEKPASCTELVENSDPLSASEWKAFIAAFSKIEGEFDRIVFSGNLPPHAPQDIYAELLSRTDGSKVLIDSYGPPLLATLEHRPALIKINAEELGSTLKESGNLEELARELIAQGAGAVGVTNGKESAMLVTPNDVYSIAIPHISAINPIGSGDAVSAGTTYALSSGSSTLEAFIFGLACGTSNAMNLNPGSVQLEQIASLVPKFSIN